MNNVDLAENALAPEHGLAPAADAGPAQDRLLRVNRALKLLSACNDAVMRAQAETLLLNDICRLIVERGDYVMAWVGIAEADAGKSVRPVAQFGDTGGYLEHARITWNDTEYGSGTSGTAIKTGRVQVNQNFLTTPSMKPWCASAVEHGYQSCISLPLQEADTTYGVLTIYSPQAQTFSAEVANLLGELARNVGYGIAHLREQRRRQAIEHELRESERRFRVLVENAPDAIVVFDLEQNRLVDANANAENLFECSRKELLQRSPQDFYPPCQPDAFPVALSFKENNERALAGDYPVFERLVRGARGRETLCEVRLVRLPFAGRKLVRGSFLDITERSKQQQELRHSRETNFALAASANHLRSILDNLFAYVALLDADGVILEINQAPLDRGKYRREHAIGKRLCDLPSWSYDDDVRSQLIDAIKAARQGQTRRYDVAIKIGGELVAIDFQIAPVRNALGEAAGLLATAVDITKRQKADDALRESENKFRILFESANDCLLLLSSEGRILDINHAGAQRLGYTKGEMLGRSISEFDPPEFAVRVQQRMEQITRDGHATFESTHLRKDGTRMPVEINSMHVEMKGKELFFSIVRDITGRKLAELAVTEAMQKLQQKEMAKTRFLAAAGHDLRQPLMAANLYIDTLKRARLEPAQKEIVERLAQVMGTFKALLDALLNISKFDAGAVKPEYCSISVPELLIWIEDNFAPVARNSRIAFQLYFPMKEQLAVRSDPGLLKSILMNLVSNAIKFTPNGAVLLSARRRGKEVLFQIWDTGIGIPQEHLRHVFDEFYQVNNSQRDRASGLGLGLAIAQRTVALLGGRIDCRSETGRGSVFSFRLPLDLHAANARDDMPEARRNDAGSYSSAAGKRFIVVEDDALVAEAVCSALTALRGDVRCFHNAEDALVHAAGEPAAHYIVDYTLGGKQNGIQFLNQLQHTLGKHINAVLVTGDTSPAFVRSIEDCHWPVLHKPVNISELLARLDEQPI